MRVGGDEAGPYLRFKDSGFTQLQAQRPSRTCNESKQERLTPTLWEGRVGGDDGTSE